MNNHKNNQTTTKYIILPGNDINLKLQTSIMLKTKEDMKFHYQTPPGTTDFQVNYL